MYIKFQFRHHIKRGLQKTPCCKHRIKTASRQRDDDVIDKTHHQMYASTASITHNNGIQLSLEQTLAPSSTNSGSSGSGSGSGSTSSTGTASSGEQPLTNSKVGTPVVQPNGVVVGSNPGHGHLNNAFYLNNLRSTHHQPPPPPYVNQFNRFHGYPASPASLPASVRATPTADFELYPRHLRTNSYTQATQHHVNPHAAIPQQIYNPVQSTPLHRRYNNNNNAVQQQNFQLRHLRSDSCNSILSHDQISVQQQQNQQLNQQLTQQLTQQQHSPQIQQQSHEQLQSNSSTSRQQQQMLYDKLHGRQSSSSAG